MDHLHAAVADSLASFWCPTNKTAFLATLFAFVAIFCAAGVVLVRMARNRGQVPRIAGIILVLFAVGGAAMDLFGLSGCGNHPAAGVTWDWPW